MGAVSDRPLSADHLQRICDFVYRRTGMSYGESKRYFVERRVFDCMERADIPSVAAYLSLLVADPAEAERLINSFTVNETYFYREAHQLRCLSTSLLPEIVATLGAGDLVRLWSVPCASGEEPYSLAIWLLENWRLVDAYNIEIVGSDIDTAALEAAVAGDYGERALARLPDDVKKSYFEKLRDGRWRIIQDLRESVQFTPVNLVDAASMQAGGQFDVIFCRNVLIYFDDASRLAAAKNLFAALKPGGFICLGHTESMGRIFNGFSARRFADAVVYQRPAA